MALTKQQLQYDSPASGTFNFRNVLGAEPHVRRRVRYARSPSGGQQSARHTITITGYIIPDQTLTDPDLIQEDLDGRRKQLELLESFLTLADGSLILFNTDGSTVSWQYGGAVPLAATATWWPTRNGLHVQDVDFPDGAAVHSTHEKYTLTVEAEVEAECVEGVILCEYDESRRWETGILVEISFTGRVRTCAPAICETEVDTIIASVEGAVAVELGLPAVRPPNTQSTSHRAKPGGGTQECTFSFGWSLAGAIDTGEDVDAISATMTINQNRVDASIQATWIFTPATRRARLNQAAHFTGVNIRNYLPDGATVIADPEVQISLGADRVVATAKVVAYWEHSSSILEITETVQRQRGMPRARAMPKGWLDSDTSPPEPKIHIGGLGPVTLKVDGTIVGVNAYQEVPDRLGGASLGAAALLPVQTDSRVLGCSEILGSFRPGSGAVVTGSGSTNLWRTSYTQSYMASNDTELGDMIPVNSLFRLLGADTTEVVA